jgi:hypothetical protein
MIADFTFSVLLNVVFFALFVTMFFFVMISRFELKSVDANVTRATAEMTSTLIGGLDAETKQTLNEALNRHLVVPDLAREDQAVKASNKKLLTNTWTVIGGIGAGVLAASTALAYYFGLSIEQHYVDAGVVLLFVAMAEFLFLLLVAQFYQSIDTNKTKLKIIDTLQRFIDS